MKKISLFVALAIAGMATAQVQLAPEQMEIRKATSTASAKAVKEASAEVFTAESYAKYSQAAEYTDVDYYYVEGMMHGGSTPQGYVSTPAIMLPGLETVTFTNVYGATDWYTSAASNALLAESSETLELAFGYDYLLDFMGYSPYTTDHTLEQDGQTYNIKGYRYAASKQVSCITYGSTPWGISTGENIPMTLCGMYCDPIYGSDGNDCYMVGNADATRGKYLYGTNRLVEGVRADTIGQFVRNLSTMKIEQISINVYNADQNGAVMFPAGTKIKVELFNADLATGAIDWEEPVATTVLSEADYVSWGDGYEWSGNLIVKFYEEDIFGSITEVPVWVSGDFYLQITGFNESGCDFGIRSDFYNINTGSTVYTVNGVMTYGASQGGCNLNIGYDAYWPVLVNDTTLNEMNAPVAGGMCHYGEDTEDYVAILYTNVYDVEGAWSIETPEWVSVYAVDTTYLSQAGAVMIAFEAEELPAEIEGRTEVVSIDADGFVYEFVINQGEVVNTGVENVVAPLFDDKIYNLLGVEVDENYKGIVIKNGEKFIQ